MNRRIILVVFSVAVLLIVFIKFNFSQNKISGIFQWNFLEQQDFNSIPIHKKNYNLDPPLSKDLIAHSAYFDPRPRDNHENVTVILLNVNKTIMDRGWVIGCGVDGKDAPSFFLYSVFENRLMHNWLGRNPFVYEHMAMLCYDMPGKNGSEVYVLYKTGTYSHEIKAISRHPLFISSPRITPSNGYNFTTLTCTKVHNRGVYFFHEFVQYQKTLGVDHVHVSILDHFITDSGFEDLVVKDSFLWKQYEEGYLTFSVWKEWYAKGKWNKGEIYLHAEILRKLDCIYRFLGTYDFVMPLDVDDFFVPRIPGKTKLKDYILQYCYSKPAGSCRFQWIWQYPQCGIDGEVTDGNVTKHLRTKIYSLKKSWNYKSLHSTMAILDASFHHAGCKKCLRDGYRLVDVPTSVAYVAHNRYPGSKNLNLSECNNEGPLL